MRRCQGVATIALNYRCSRLTGQIGSSNFCRIECATSSFVILSVLGGPGFFPRNDEPTPFDATSNPGVYSPNKSRCAWSLRVVGRCDLNLNLRHSARFVRIERIRRLLEVSWSSPAGPLSREPLSAEPASRL